jgi:hypothetical protein
MTCLHESPLNDAAGQEVVYQFSLMLPRNEQTRVIHQKKQNDKQINDLFMLFSGAPVNECMFGMLARSGSSYT